MVDAPPAEVTFFVSSIDDDGESVDAADATDLSDVEGSVDEDVAMVPTANDVGDTASEDDDEDDMFAAPAISQTACKATCSSKGAGSPHPVFAQCNQPASTDGDSCEKHVRGQLKSACDWEPLTFFLGLPDKALTAAWKCACSRYK